MDRYIKLNYLLEEHYMTATEITKAFGFKSNTMVTNMKQGTANISQLHLDGLEKYFHIPQEVFSRNVNAFETIDMLIEKHIEQKKKEMEANLRKNKILDLLEKEDLIPKDIFTTKLMRKGELENFIKEHKEKLFETSQPSLQSKHSSTVFPKNEKLFKKLIGTWYGYLYPSNLASSKEGIWKVETTINDDYSVIDHWKNKGYIQLGKHESLIIKESYDNDDLTIIRFSNRQVPSQHIRFVIISNQNNTPYEMVNFGFYSRKQYSAKEAKEILGDINTKQLKLDLAFNDRLNKRAIVPQ